MKSLYRKWRPLKLAEVIGQDQVTRSLGNALAQGRISHAYLFTGPRGTGKTSVARIFAHEINHFDYKLEDDYVDIIEIDGASNRGVDNIREIREKAAIAPTIGKYKIYIIDEVHMLTKEAFNALLKTLEEPPEHVIFIMATTDAHKVPITITSRAQTYNFKLVEPDVVLRHLREICKEENFNIDDDALAVIVKRGGGSFRDSLSLLDQVSTLSSDNITKAMVEKAFGLPEDEKIQALIGAYSSGDVVKITTLTKDLLAAGVKAEIIAEEIIRSVVEKPSPLTLPLIGKLPEVKAPFAEARLIYALASGHEIKAPSVPTASSMPAISSAPSTPTQPQPEANNSKNSFDWQEFLEEMRGVNDVIATQLNNTSWEIARGELLIAPAKSFAKVILSKPNNLRLMSDVAGMTVKIKTLETSKNNTKNSRISDIMGGEVQEYGGGSPF